MTRRIINVSNPFSVVEWEKQKAVRAIQPKAKRDREDNINETLEKDTIEVTARFDGAETAEASLAEATNELSDLKRQISQMVSAIFGKLLCKTSNIVIFQ